MEVRGTARFFAAAADLPNLGDFGNLAIPTSTRAESSAPEKTKSRHKNHIPPYESGMVTACHVLLMS